MIWGIRLWLLEASLALKGAVFATVRSGANLSLSLLRLGKGPSACATSPVTRGIFSFECGPAYCQQKVASAPPRIFPDWLARVPDWLARERESQLQIQIQVGICYHQWVFATVANTHWVFSTVANTHHWVFATINEYLLPGSKYS